MDLAKVHWLIGGSLYLRKSEGAGNQSWISVGTGPCAFRSPFPYPSVSQLQLVLEFGSGLVNKDRAQGSAVSV